MAKSDNLRNDKGQCITKYKPEYCDLIIEHMSEGHSLASFCAKIKVSRVAVYRWIQQNEDFRNSHRIATEACQTWWEGIGRAGAVGKIKGFNAAAWIFSMKNRFNWGDKIDIEHTEKKKIESMTDAEIMDAVKKRIKALSK